VGEARNVHNTLVRKSEGKKQLGRPRRRWKYNIRMDVRRTGWKLIDWILMVHDRGQ
jgi:hypothetical protein